MSNFICQHFSEAVWPTKIINVFCVWSAGGTQQVVYLCVLSCTDLKNGYRGIHHLWKILVHLQIKTARTANCESSKNRLTSHSSLWQVITEHETKCMPAVLDSALLLFELYPSLINPYTHFLNTRTLNKLSFLKQTLLLGSAGGGKKEKIAEYKNSTFTYTLIRMYRSVLAKKGMKNSAADFQNFKSTLLGKNW